MKASPQLCHGSGGIGLRSRNERAVDWFPKYVGKLGGSCGSRPLLGTDISRQGGPSHYTGCRSARSRARGGVHRQRAGIIGQLGHHICVDVPLKVIARSLGSWEPVIAQRHRIDERAMTIGMMMVRRSRETRSSPGLVPDIGSIVCRSSAVGTGNGWASPVEWAWSVATVGARQEVLDRSSGVRAFYSLAAADREVQRFLLVQEGRS